MLETWLLNETISPPTSNWMEEDVEFMVNGVVYTSCVRPSDANKFDYGDGNIVYTPSGGWVNDVYRTIVIKSMSKSSRIYKWIKANGVQQDITPVNKVVGGDGKVLLDLTEDDVSGKTLVKGVKAHCKGGYPIVGTLEVPKLIGYRSFSLDLANGDQRIKADDGTGFTDINITKPSTLLSSNIKKDVNIAGVTGEYQRIGDVWTLNETLQMYFSLDSIELSFPTVLYCYGTSSSGEEIFCQIAGLKLEKNNEKLSLKYKMVDTSLTTVYDESLGDNAWVDSVYRTIVTHIDLMKLSTPYLDSLCWFRENAIANPIKLANNIRNTITENGIHYLHPPTGYHGLLAPSVLVNIPTFEAITLSLGTGYSSLEYTNTSGEYKTESIVSSNISNFCQVTKNTIIKLVTANNKSLGSLSGGVKLGSVDNVYYIRIDGDTTIGNAT